MLSTIVILITAFTTRMLFNAFKVNVVHHQMSVKVTGQKESQLRVFFISDIHRRKIDKQLVRKIEGKIDIVVIGGDLVEKGVPLARVLKNLQNLSRLGPIYFVWGNNDREVGEANIRALMEQVNGTILDNNSSPILGHSAWGICGTDDVSSRNVDLNLTSRNLERYQHIIFVTHQPKVFTEAEDLLQPALMLAGHTHGGQIRLGKLGLFEKGTFQSLYNRGKLISNGFGTSTIPLRFGAASECHIITIDYA